MPPSPNGSAHPWDFVAASEASKIAAGIQRQAEQWLISSARDLAAKEEAYRVKLATRIVELHDEGAAWTVAPDLARGDKRVAALRRERDVAEGVREAAVQAAWRAAADRKDTGRFCEWSMRADLRDEQPVEDGPVFGARRAA